MRKVLLVAGLVAALAVLIYEVYITGIICDAFRIIAGG